LINKSLPSFGEIILCLSRLSVLLAALLQAGCTSVEAPPRELPQPQPIPEGFISQGKISLRPIGESKIKGFSANYRWQQIGGSYDLELWGALGQGRTRITGTADSIEIVDGSGRVVKSRKPERLLKRHLGWSLPLAVLPFWLQGTAAPNAPATMMRFQPNADLERLEQLGWNLKFDRYQPVTGLTRQERLPGRIRASSPELKLTIVSRDWSL